MVFFLKKSVDKREQACYTCVVPEREQKKLRKETI
nr:MAG TPA: hypothetical protein [Caudoviricetes sp.]